MTAHKKLIAIDFDGVLHSYTSPWTDAATISDGPTPGAMQFLKALVDDERFEVVIVSSRMSEPDGRRSVYTWIRGALDGAFGPSEKERLFDAISFSTTRPPAFVTIDDRAWTFQGDWPDLDDLASFKPWNKGATHIADTEAPRVIADLVSMLLRVARKPDGDTQTIAQIHDYLNRKGINPSPLRSQVDDVRNAERVAS